MSLTRDSSMTIFSSSLSSPSGGIFGISTHLVELFKRSCYGTSVTSYCKNFLDQCLSKILTLFYQNALALNGKKYS